MEMQKMMEKNGAYSGLILKQNSYSYQVTTKLGLSVILMKIKKKESLYLQLVIRATQYKIHGYPKMI